MSSRSINRRRVTRGYRPTIEHAPHSGYREPAGGAVSLVVCKDLMGALAAAIGLASYAIYVWQSLRGEARPHPLSWLIFGILSGTGYLVQVDQAAGPGSWVMGITAVVCLLLCVM